MSYSTQSGVLTRNGRSLKQYIYVSTLLGVFTGAFFIKFSFDVQFFYLLMIVNFILMSFFVRAIVIPKWLVVLLTYLLTSGVIGILTGTDTLAQFLKQFIGITLSAIYFFYFFKLQENDTKKVFGTYLRIANWVTYIGFAQCLVGSLRAHSFVRLESIMGEPAGYATLILPAYYWYAHSYLFDKKCKRDFLITTSAILLSQSSLAFIGIAFGVVLMLPRRRFLIVAAPFTVSALGILFYITSYQFSVRANDTIAALTSSDVTDVNISTYALITNLFVTEKVLSVNPILGNGLGSHVVSHDRYIGSIPGVENFVERGLGDLNATEAASLTLRSLSELGIIGFAAILWFLFHFHVGGASDRAVVSNAILVCFFVKLVRIGTYFPPEQFFFVFIYMLNYKQHRKEVGVPILVS